MNKFTKMLFATAFSFAAASANATVFDFAGVTGPNETGGQPLTFTEGTLVLQVFGHNTTAGVDAVAYLDAFTGGLGVCSTGLSTKTYGGVDYKNQCDTPSDDNVTENEYLEFVFAGPMQINSISFNNNHDGGFIKDASKITIGGMAYVTPVGVANLWDAGYKQTATAEDPFSGVHVSSFTVAYDNTQFYVQSIDVPEPAGIALLGLGLLGFGAARRAKR